MTRALFQDVRRSAVAVAFVFAAAQGFPGIAAAGGQVAGQPSQPEAPEAVEQAPAAQPAKPVSDPAQAARSAVEARHAEHMARMEEHQKAMRERAAAQGIDLPEPPPLPEAPKWLSYEEMRAEMKNRGIDMPPLPRQEGGPGLPEPPSMPIPCCRRRP